jgi:ubiquinone/menaquinone biosynthesis C-methylase UbiE
VVAVEPEPYLRALARRAAADVAATVEVVDGRAERLPIADQKFDAAVVSLVLCSVRTPAAVLREIRRALRPGGQLRFLEHVRSPTRAMSWLQRGLDATCWPLLAGGCHMHRDSVASIRAAGFRIVEVESFRVPDQRVSTPTALHVRGVAISPGSSG